MQYHKLNLTVDIESLQKELQTTELWDKYPFRRLDDSPHAEMTDIWVRYNDIQPYLKAGDLSQFNCEHDSVWYDEKLKKIIKPIANKIMHHVQGERLGGILITKLPPYGKIKPHTDSGWHAGYYDKYYVCVKDSGSKFVFDDGHIEPSEGDVWWFDNSQTHAVENGNKERIAMIICIKTDKESCLGVY